MKLKRKDALECVLFLNTQKIPVTCQELVSSKQPGEARRSTRWPLLDFPILCFFPSTCNYRSTKKARTTSQNWVIISMWCSHENCHLEKLSLFYSQNWENLCIHPPIHHQIYPSIILLSTHPSFIHSSTTTQTFSEDISCDTASASVVKINVNKTRFLPCCVILQSGKSLLNCRVFHIHAGSCWCTMPCFINNFDYTFVYSEDP